MMKLSKSQTSFEPARVHCLESLNNSSTCELQAMLYQSNDCNTSSKCQSKGVHEHSRNTMIKSYELLLPVSLDSSEISVGSVRRSLSDQNVILQKSESTNSCQQHTSLSYEMLNMNVGRDRLHSVTSTESMLFCRICHQGESDEVLLQLCRCSGTMGQVHKSCMERWLGTGISDMCEICGFTFKTERSAKPFSEWVRNLSNSKERRNLVTDLLCFIVLTPLACISSWLCYTGARHYHIHSTSQYNWVKWGLGALTFVLISIYFLWCIVATRYHWRVYHSWCHNNQFVRLLNISVEKVLTETTVIDKDENNNTVISTQALCDASPTVRSFSSETLDTSDQANDNLICQQFSYSNYSVMPEVFLSKL